MIVVGLTSLCTELNGTLITAGWHSYPRTYSMAAGHVKLYVQPTRANGSIVRYLFQFNTGASFTVEVLYSKMVGRQYIDTEFNPVDAFLGNTEGLCGLLDSNRNNDLMGPSGELFDNATAFAESCAPILLYAVGSWLLVFPV